MSSSARTATGLASTLAAIAFATTLTACTSTPEATETPEAAPVSVPTPTIAEQRQASYEYMINLPDYAAIDGYEWRDEVPAVNGYLIYEDTPVATTVNYLHACMMLDKSWVSYESGDTAKAAELLAAAEAKNPIFKNDPVVHGVTLRSSGFSGTCMVALREHVDIPGR